MPTLLRVLILEDNLDDAELMLHEIRGAGFDVAARVVDEEREFLRALAEGPNVILADHSLPQFDALSALSTLKAKELDIPFLVVGGTTNEELVVEAMRQGAADYLLKDRLARLGPAVARALEEGRSKQEKRRAELTLRESEAGYRTLVETIEDSICVKDLQGRYTMVNDAFVRKNGRRREETIGITAAEVYDAPFSLQVAAMDLKVLQTGEAVKGVEEHPDRETWRYVDIRKVPLKDPEGRIRGVATAARDVTEQKRAELTLRESEERYRGLFQAVPGGVVVQDAGGAITHANDAACEILGLSLEQIRGRLVAELLGGVIEVLGGAIGEDGAPFDEEGHPATIALRTGQPVHNVVMGVLHPGTNDRVWILMNTEPLLSLETGRVEGAVCSFVDITERRRLELRLVQAERLQAAGRIASQVSHDFNNLLGPFLAYPELIKMSLPAGHPAAGMCASMLESAKRMAEINQDMLAFGRRGLMEEKPVALNELVRQSLETLGPLPDGVTVELSLDHQLPAVGGSPAQLSRVLVNLISNAREASEGGGRIAIASTVVRAEHPFGRIERIEEGDYVRLSVSDNGPGIPPEIQEKMFDAFFTTKKNGRTRGSGLGLSIVHAVVKDHKGYIDLETKVGAGSTFSVYLPVWVDRRERGPRIEETRGSGETILVVNDDPILRKTLRTMLSALGYRAEVAGSGGEAVAHLREREVHLLLLDMKLSNHAGGVEAYRRILEFRPGQRAVVMTGDAEPDEVREVARLGIRAWLQKPTRLEDLAQAVRGELDRQD